MRYAGWGTQLFVMLGLGVYGGYQADKFLELRLPLFTLLIPFIILLVMIIQLIKNTSKRKSEHDK